MVTNNKKEIQSMQLTSCMRLDLFLKIFRFMNRQILPDNKAFHPVEPVQQLQPFFFAQGENGGAQGIPGKRIVGTDCDGGETIIIRIAGLRV